MTGVGLGHIGHQGHLEDVGIDIVNNLLDRLGQLFVFYWLFLERDDAALTRFFREHHSRENQSVWLLRLVEECFEGNFDCACELGNAKFHERDKGTAYADDQKGGDVDKEADAAVSARNSEPNDTNGTN